MKRAHSFHNALRVLAGIISVVVVLFAQQAAALDNNSFSCAQQGDFGGTCFYDPNNCATAADTSPVCACTTTATTPSLAGGNNVEAAWGFFKQKGLNDAQAAGVVGNLQDESTQKIDPELNENGSGDSTTQPKTGGADGWGIAQWTYPQQDFDALMAKYNISGKGYDIMTQLTLVWDQMNDISPTGVKNMLSGFKQLNDPSQAASYFDSNFEGGIPGNRIANAVALYGNKDQLNQGAAAGSPATPGVSSGLTASDTLEGHKLPATVGGTGDEDPVDATGHLTTTGGAVTFSQFASLGQNYRDYYITMRWRYALWNWDGTSTAGPENSAWYGQKPRLVLVTNPRNHKSIIADIMESGPAPWTGVDTQSNNTPKQGWTNPQDGTPSTYKGRVSGFPPPAIQALGAIQTMSNGSGDKLEYAWAPDQSAQPGPTNLQVDSAGTGGTGDCGSSGTVSGGSYQNPFRDIQNLTPQRIDQGVDYDGTGPIYALGDGTINNVYPGWCTPSMGGCTSSEPLLAYTLTDGKAKGKTVYVAECINVAQGVLDGSIKQVTPNTVIATMTNCGNGIETGWANTSSLPDAMAKSCFNGSDSTAYGKNFSDLLQSLGSKPGIMTGTLTCNLPSDWPTW